MVNDAGLLIRSAAILSCLRKSMGIHHGRIEITRRKYQRDRLRYASDTTGAEWAVSAHTATGGAFGRLRKTSLREIVNAILAAHAAPPKY